MADFGVAATLAEQRLASAPGPVGTDGYLPPERLAGTPPDPRQDLYAAGRVATELLTGVRASDRTPTGPLGPLLHALTEPDPERRTATASAALAHLRALGVPTGDPAPGGPFVPDRLARHRRWARP